MPLNSQKNILYYQPEPVLGIFLQCRGNPPLLFAGLLRPIMAAGAVALSSVRIVGNSLRARVR